MTSLVEDDREIVGHHMLIARGRLDRYLLQSDPILRVLLAIIFVELLELEIERPYDLSKIRGKLLQPRGACVVSYSMCRMFSWLPCC